MTETPDTSEVRRPWHQGYLDPKAWVITLLGGMATALLWDTFKPFSQEIGKYLSGAIGAVSQNAIDGAYARAVTTPEYTLLQNAWTTYVVVMALMMVPYIALTWIMYFRGPNFAGLLITADGKMGIATPLAVTLISTIFLLAFGSQLILNDLTYRVESTWQRRHIILDPLVSHEEKTSIAQKWGSLSSQKEFDLLMREMDAVARRRGAQLPARIDR